MPEAPREPAPRSDPSALATDALERAIGALTDLMDAKVAGLTEMIELKECTTAEKFRSIQTQFALGATAADKLAVANQDALAAALQAQKEDAAVRNESTAAAIAKSEAGFTKQIDGIGTLINTMTGSFDDKLNDLKSRLDRGDGRTNGVSDQRIDKRENVGMIVGVVGAIVAALMLAIAVAAIMGATK